MKIGDIDLVNTILRLESDLYVLQQTVIFMMDQNATLKRPSSEDILRYRSISVERLKSKYPNMDIQETK